MLPNRPTPAPSSSSSSLPSCSTALPARRRGALAHPLFAAFGVAFPLLFASQLLISCGSSDKGSKVCNPGDSKSCIGTPGQCSGTQTCNDQGSGYDTCECGSTATGNGGSSAGTGGASNGGTSSTSTAGSGGATAPLFPGGVGAPCTSDAGCGGAPLVCALASSDTFTTSDPQTGAAISGGPQGGYCTLPCQATADCQAVDNISVCNTAVGYCFGLCTPSTGQIKCVDSQGTASAEACFQLNQTDTSLGVCLPTCTNDAGCGSGRYCDLSTGLCIGTKPTGKAIGEACDDTLNGADCASGTCVQFDVAGQPVSFCSGNCTLGILDNCGYDPALGQPRNVACLEPQFDQASPGDIGFCLSLCDTNADCAQAAAGWICEPLSASGVQALGRAGECVPPGLGGAADAGPG